MVLIRTIGKPALEGRQMLPSVPAQGVYEMAGNGEVRGYPPQLREGETQQTQLSVETNQKKYRPRLTRSGKYNVLAHFSSI